MKFDVEMERVERATVTITAANRSDAVKTALAAKPGFAVLSAGTQDDDGIDVAGECEGCHVIIFEDEYYGCDEDGVYVCTACMSE